MSPYFYAIDWPDRVMAEQPVQRSYWPEKAIDWPEPAQ